MLRPEVIRDLRLERHGLRMGQVPSAGLQAAFEDGTVVPWWSDRHRAVKEFASSISERDANSFDRVHRRLHALARYLQPFFLEEPPNLYARGWAKVREGSRAWRRFRKISGDELADLVRFTTGSLGEFVERHFETDRMRRMYLANNVYGMHAPPYMPGTAIGLLFHLLSGPLHCSDVQVETCPAPRKPAFSLNARPVGTNVRRKDGPRRSPARRGTPTTSSFPACSTGGPIRSHDPARDDPRHPPRLRSRPASRSSIARDIPGRNVVALIEDDQPCLAEREVRHVAEPILLLAHEDRETLLAAQVRDRVRAERRRCSIRSIVDAVFKDIDIEKGDVDARLRRAPTSIVEGDVPHRPPGARLHRAQRRDRRARGRRRHGLRLAAVSRSTCTRRSRRCSACRATARARGADRDRRRIRRQGRVSRR